MGGRIEHDCGTERSISYFLEPLLVLAPFSKKPFVLTLEGITTDHIDPSVRSGLKKKTDCLQVNSCGLSFTFWQVDIIRTVLIPQLARFGIEENVQLKVKNIYI
jgi:RNA 3'-terminal phosphate cyclase-like protein